jgi:hypothetical protein
MITRKSVIANLVIVVATLWLSQGTFACDLSHAFGIAKSQPKSKRVLTLEALERRSTDQGEWKILIDSLGVRAIERYDNNEWGFTRTRYAKIRGGLVISFYREQIVTSDDTPPPTTSYIVKCDETIYFGMPSDLSFETTADPRIALANATELISVLARAKEISKYAAGMVAQ